jgi:hypothetical protein
MILKPFSATAAASADEIQTLCPIQQRENAKRVRRSHNDRVVCQGNVEGQGQLLPYNGGLSNFFQCLVLGLREITQGLFKCLSGSSQGGLSLWIVRIASSVDFIAASAEVVSGEKLCGVYQQISGKANGVRGSKTELPGGRFVGI